MWCKRAKNKKTGNLKSDETTKEKLNVEVNEFYVDFPLYRLIAQLVRCFIGTVPLNFSGYMNNKGDKAKETSAI